MNLLRKYANIKLFLISLISIFLLGPIRLYLGIEYSTVLGCIFYFMLYLIGKSIYGEGEGANIKVFFAIVLPILLVNIPIRVSNFEGSLRTLPEVCVQIMTLLLAYLYTKFHRSGAKIANFLVIFFLTCLIILSFNFYRNWFNYVNYGNFSGQTREILSENIQVYDQERKEYNLKHSQKIRVLDLWHTGCGACFEEFPWLQKINEINDPRIAVYAVNVPLRKEDPDKVFDMIKSRSYTFQTVIAKDSSLYKKLDVKAFPTVYIINEKNNVIFKGGTQEAFDELKGILK